MIKIGELNGRITIKPWTVSKDAGGGGTAVAGTTYSVWAKVEDRSGVPVTTQNQQQWNYDYKITFRYENSRPVTSNETIIYDGKTLAINSISFENEGERKYVIARCSTTGVEENNLFTEDDTILLTEDDNTILL